MNVKFLIIDRNSIFMEGLKKILQEEYPGCKIKEINKIENIEDKIKLYKPNIVFVGNCYLNFMSFELWNFFEEKNCKTVIVAEDISKINKKINFNEVIDYTFEKKHFFEIVQKHIPILSKEELFFESINTLTKREKEILKCIANGKSNKEIGAKLKITERTVKNHIYSIFKKINVSDRTQAAVVAIKHNIINI